MSQTEFHSGKIKKVETDDVESFCKEKCNQVGITELSSYNDSWLAQLRWDNKINDQYIVLHGDLYMILEHYENDDPEYFCNVTNNDDGTINFITSFYNGGTCLEEMLEDEIK